ncbi:MAG: zinc ABC transporter substrate-binding protein [Chitinivibrionales bacterium]|nr:zinc ABC transporter substrate-binding protein [Chitinivibrionales bacterium]
MIKIIKRHSVLLPLSISIFFLVYCTHRETKNSRIAFVTVLPQKSFVERIAGDRFEVHAFVGPGQSPHNFTPTPNQMAKLSQATLFFRIGVECEEGIIPKISQAMPQVKIIDLRQGVAIRDMKEEEEEFEAGHDHNELEEGHTDSDHDGVHHSMSGKDPHIWLSPTIAKQIIITIRDALVKVDPQGKTIYEENMRKLGLDLDTLDAYLRIILAPYKGSNLFVFHPAFGYFTDHYGLVQKAVETGGKEPSAQALARLIDQARQYKPHVIFVQPQYSQKSAQTIAAQINCVIVPINPLPEDYFKEMRAMGEAIQKGLAR